ncbi:Endoribonuclease L-PSP [Acephala macrosclerotiorum]|nr:Endoribonuclease L-PSP [Acephala macrosclerotiorum]
MSDIVPILTKNAMPPVGPYSQAIKTKHAIYCSGQLPADAQGNIVQGTMGEKTAAVLKALSAVLAEGGSSLDKIVKAQIFLTDMSDFAEMNAEYEKWIKHNPARSCVAVKQLPKGVNIEIECVALP